MTKGELTRQFILEQTAPVFNKLGYGATTLDDIKAATGLEKGGIYRHFSGKEEIAIEAFEYSCQVTYENMNASLEDVEGGLNRLYRFLDSFFNRTNLIGGGCPIFNTAVEHDDGHPVLKKKAQLAYKRVVKEIVGLIDSAKAEGSLRKDAASEPMAIFLLSAVEGGLISRNLNGKDSIGQDVLAELHGYLETKKTAEKSKK